MKNTVYIVIAVILLAGGVILYSQRQPTEAPTKNGDAIEDQDDERSDGATEEKEVDEKDNEKEENGEKDEKNETNEDAETTVTVTGKSFSFDPKEIRVKKGDDVKIVFKNAGGTHDWVLDEFNVRTKQTSSGETDTVEFTADKTGTFEYYCSIGNHRQQGMKGNLIVE